MFSLLTDYHTQLMCLATAKYFVSTNTTLVKQTCLLNHGRLPSLVVTPPLLYALVPSAALAEPKTNKQIVTENLGLLPEGHAPFARTPLLSKRP